MPQYKMNYEVPRRVKSCFVILIPLLRVRWTMKTQEEWIHVLLNASSQQFEKLKLINKPTQFEWFAKIWNCSGPKHTCFVQDKEWFAKFEKVKMPQYKTNHEILTCIRKKVPLMSFKEAKMTEWESVLIDLTMLNSICKDSIVPISSQVVNSSHSLERKVGWNLAKWC